MDGQEPRIRRDLDVTAPCGAEGQRLQVMLHSAVEVGGETENWKRTKLMEA